jgi:prepilin-type processing-associated H-X9-DG protein
MTNPWGGQGVTGGYENIGGFGTPPGVALARITVPAETLLLVESHTLNNVTNSWSMANSNGPFARRADGSNASGTPLNRQDALTPRQPFHFDGWNYLFTDGHAKWLRPEKTIEDY